ncbi:MAG: cation:proton antiporter, partial [Anaeroplasmataceae bacterium]|nr:cation:proton antiporter [Anaeroplasmataceae bacterium]
MILSFGIILLGGFIIGYLLNKIKIPGLVGMLLFGLFIGPQFLDLIDKSVLGISSELRQIALVIILTSSGLNLDFNSLKKIGRPAILLCFIPATVEIIGVTIASIYLLKLSVFESLLLGSVLAAVSPAVVSPRMIELIEGGYGVEHQVPKLILAGASV